MGDVRRRRGEPGHAADGLLQEWSSHLRPEGNGRRLLQDFVDEAAASDGDESLVDQGPGAGHHGLGCAADRDCAHAQFRARPIQQVTAEISPQPSRLHRFLDSSDLVAI